MKDLQEILQRIKDKYQAAGKAVPIFEEGVLGTKWYMSADNEKHISFALRADGPLKGDEYEEIIRGLIGKPLDVCVEQLLSMEGKRVRGIIVSILNLLSKPFNNKEELAKKGIIRTEGLNFEYNVSGKKVGLIGYGVYLNFLLGKCAEFHAFDLRREEDIFSTRVSAESTETYPEGVIFHLGKNATEFKDVLSRMDIVIMSGSTIVNDSYREILEASKNAEIAGIYGPSNELCPEYLFDLGFNYIFSTSVRDKDAYLKEALSASPFFREFEFMDIYELKKA